MQVAVHNRLTAVPPPMLDRTAYRIVREGLTNARKHAPHVPVWLLLERESGELHVHLRNGVSSHEATPIPGSHSGLIGISERVRLVGGRLKHGVRIHRLIEPFRVTACGAG